MCFTEALSTAPVSLLVLGGIGAAVTLRYALSLATLAFNLTLRKGTSLKKYGAGTGAWAVVTGASDGIGKEFALQLARAKFNVVLLARTESKLVSVADEIRAKHGVEARVIPFDFSSTVYSDYEKLAKSMDSLDITVLVNNVGVSHDMPTPFLEESDEMNQRIIDVNISSIMKMTKVIAPKMVANKKGLILNVGSFAGLLPQPMLSVYSASKAYLLTWSQAVGRELQPLGVDVQCYSTYFVVSAMSKIRKPNALIPSAAGYVRSALASLGNPGGAPTPFTSTPYPSHAAVNWVIAHVGTAGMWLDYVYKTQADIRRRALKKRAREEKKE
ncbi:hypothetical protein BC828DRAFT_405609 [Blastocladiella britannica]|nr:hypothetical protein BC828DRAFT_405609 [Blastocladiella britannica]